MIIYENKHPRLEGLGAALCWLAFYTLDLGVLQGRLPLILSAMPQYTRNCLYHIMPCGIVRLHYLAQHIYPVLSLRKSQLPGSIHYGGIEPFHQSHSFMSVRRGVYTLEPPLLALSNNCQATIVARIVKDKNLEWSMSSLPLLQCSYEFPCIL